MTGKLMKISLSAFLLGLDLHTALAAKQLLEVRMECDKKQVYIGESLKCRTKVFHQGQVHSVVKAEADSKDLRRQRYEEHRVYRDTLDGERVIVIEFQEAIIPLKVGKQEISSLAIGGTVEERRESSGSRGGGIFNFNYSFSSIEEKDLPIAKTTLTVKPWPKPRPSAFSGAVGRFDVSLTSPASNIKVGEPISFELKMSGNGSLFLQEDFQFERIADQFGLQSYPNKPERQTDLNEEGFYATYKQNFIFIPTNPGTINLPSIPFAFFNPNTAKYEEIPIELGSFTVKPSMQAGLATKPQTNTSVDDKTPPESPGDKQVLQGSILDHQQTSPNEMGQQGKLRPLSISNWWLEHYNALLLGLSVIPLGVVGLGVTLKTRRRLSKSGLAKKSGSGFKLKPSAHKKLQKQMIEIERDSRDYIYDAARNQRSLRQLRGLISELVDPAKASVTFSYSACELEALIAARTDVVDMKQLASAKQALELIKIIEAYQYAQPAAHVKTVTT